MKITKYLGIIILSVSIILSGILFFLLHKYNIHGIRRKHDIIKIIIFQIVMLVGGIILLLIKPSVGSGSNSHCDLSGLKNVYIFKETDDPITLLNTLDQINTLQGGINGTPHGASETSCSHPGGTNSGQWSTNRFVLLFLPGTYSVSFQIPYYVSVIGCGRSPEDVIFNDEIVQKVYKDKSKIADKTVSGKVDKVLVYEKDAYKKMIFLVPKN